MEHIYNKIFDDLKETIYNSSDDELESKLYRDDLLGKFSVEAPFLDKSGLSVEIKSKTLTHNNAPEGFDYHKGDMVNYAYYSIPIRGKVALLEHRLADLISSSNKFALVDNFLFVEEYSFEKIENNENAIANVKDLLIKDLEFIQSFIEQIKAEVADFKAKLSEEIDIEIASELERRTQRRITLEQLNPYD